MGMRGDPTNPPQLSFSTTDGLPYWVFDGTTLAPAEVVRFEFRLPDDYATPGTAPVMHVQWSNGGSNTDDVIWQCQVHKLTPNSDADNASAARTYHTVNKSAADTGVATNRLQEIDITMSNMDSAVAGDLLAFYFFRDPDETGDTITDDCQLWSLTFEYTTT